MAFTKITNSELNSRGATTLPNQPTISAAALKQEFDAPAKEIVAPHFNGLIDELEADTAGASIGLQAPSRRTGSTVKAVVDAISQDLVTVEGKLNGVTNAGLLDAIYLKHGHENKALLDTYDQTNEDIKDAVNRKHSHSNKSVLDKWSESAGGTPLYNGQAMSGDMYSSEYDPDSTVKNAGGIELYVTNGLGTKVDKVDGKGLSTNDFTDTLKNKLDGIATGAEVNVQSDWNQTNNTNDDFIKNKPSLGTASAKNSTSVVTDSTDLVESGAVKDLVGFGNKNLLPTNGYKASTGDSVTFTYNSDGSVTATGSTGSTIAEFYAPIPSELSGDFYFSGCPTGGSSSTFDVYAWDSTAGGRPKKWDGTTGSTSDFGNTSQEFKLIVGHINSIRIRIRANQSNINATFKLMLRKPTEDDIYEPYHASVNDTLGDAEVIPNKNLYVGSPSFDGYTNRSSYTLESETYNGHEVISKSASWNGAQYPIALKAGVTYTFSTMVKNASSALVWMYAASSTDTFRVSYTVGTNWTRIELSFKPTVDGIFNIRTESATNTKIYLSEYQLEVGSTATEYEPYYVPLKDVVPTKADNSVIGTVEGANASKVWSAGEHFIKDGAFKEVTQPIASGGAINDSNTVNRPIADCLVKQATFSGTTHGTDGYLLIAVSNDVKIIGTYLDNNNIYAIPFHNSSNTYLLFRQAASNDLVTGTSVSGTYYYI